MIEQNKLHYLGHRKRLKEKFLSSANKKYFHDYEIVELLLFQAIPRKDVKSLAKNLISKFKNLNGILNADHEKILTLENTNTNIILLLQLMKEFISRTLAEPIQTNNVISSWSALLDYLKFDMGNLKREQLRLLLLNNNNELIEDKIISEGTIDQTSIYPREIIRHAIFYEAVSIILVHNHPSGKVSPSSNDITMTNEIIKACSSINVNVHDHVIVGKGKYYSFKSNLLI